MFNKILLLFCLTIVNGNEKALQIDQLTSQELEILGKISRKEKDFLSNFQTPECNCEEFTCVCCLKFTLAHVEREICLDAGFNKNDMKANVDLTFDREEIFSYSLRVTKVCANLPKPLSKVEICIEAYKVDVKEMPTNGMFCMKAVLSLFVPFLSVDFNCVKWEHKRLTLQTHDNLEDETAMVNVDVNDGRIELTFDAPIQAELIQQIKELSQRIANSLTAHNQDYAKLVKEDPEKYTSDPYKWNLFMNIWKNYMT